MVVNLKDLNYMYKLKSKVFITQMSTLLFDEQTLSVPYMRASRNRPGKASQLVYF